MSYIMLLVASKGHVYLLKGGCPGCTDFSTYYKVILYEIKSNVTILEFLTQNRGCIIPAKPGYIKCRFTITYTSYIHKSKIREIRYSSV